MIKASRDNAFDLFRGIAMVAVVAIHAGGTGWKWNVYYMLVIQQVYLFAVPLFFFMSGYFLPKSISETGHGNLEFVIQKLKRILIPYFIWSSGVLFFVFKNYDISDFITKIILGRALGPYYFIVVLATLFIVTPSLYWLSRKDYGLCLIIFINIMTLIGIYYLRLFTESGLVWWKASLPFTTWIFFYYLGLIVNLKGLKNLLPRCFNQKHALYCVVGSLILSIVESFILAKEYGSAANVNSSVKFSSFLYSTFVIIYLLMMKNKIRNLSKSLIVIGKYSFGIFLIHELFRYRLSNILSANDLLYSFQPIMQIVVIVVTLCLSLFTIFIMQKILGKKIASKYLGF